MAIESPSNCWTKAEAKIGEAIAHAPAFISIIGPEFADAAGSKVFGEQLDEPLNGNTYGKAELAERRAYAQVYSNQETPFGFVRAQTNRLTPYGSTVVFIERLVTEAEQANADVDLPEAIERTFKNRIGELMEEIDAYLQLNGGPFIRSIEVSDGPGYNPRDNWQQQGVWQGVEFVIAWGMLEG
jgi:hypothetical protein